MKIHKETKDKRKVIAAVLLVLVLAGATSSYAYFIGRGDLNTSEGSRTATEDMFKSDRDQSTVLQEDPEKKNQAPNTDHPALPDAPTESGKTQVQMIASVDQSANTVYIRGGVNYPVSGGSCYALLSGPSSQSIRKDSTILSNPASTDCKTISIPVSELVPGNWTFTLRYESDNYEGTSDETPFTI